ncbi:MAG: peptide chain release factor N(5)-glutamine methyltransferase [Acutalibacteraceae bacterium]|nr:peptide chain release factor N(5)-glutamine methyltransferase [Acutalibacteraceae bacterium]
MTIDEAYRSGIDMLKSNRVPDAEFDARCLLEFALDIDPTRFFISRSELIDVKKAEYYFTLINRRMNGEPLQYILGKWEFMSNEFCVGKGVLIPRPETEKLVELAKEYLTDIEKPVVVDLCSGSGCIAISIAKLIPDATVYAVEKYDDAFCYLTKNISLNEVNNVVAVQGDLFDRELLRDVSADLIVSNPPYIRKADIETLSDEVKCEPVTALDGGEDGYDFYRFLSSYWLNEFLDKNGAVMVECAEDQGDYISELFSEYSEKNEIIYDFNGLQRIVIAYK